MADFLGSVAVATGIVAVLDSFKSATGLGVVYLLAVLFVAIRRGEGAALETAVVSVLAPNFFFIEPRHRLTISDSENVVALIVFLIAAIVVGRLALAARTRAVEAEDRARQAAAREREAELLAAAGSAVLVETDIESQLENVGTCQRLGRRLEREGRARIRAFSPAGRVRGAPAHGNEAVPALRERGCGLAQGRARIASLHRSRSSEAERRAVTAAPVS